MFIKMQANTLTGLDTHKHGFGHSRLYLKEHQESFNFFFFFFNCVQLTQLTSNN